MSILIDAINEDVKPDRRVQFEVYAWNRDQDRWVFWSQHHDEQEAVERAQGILKAPNINGVRIEAV